MTTSASKVLLVILDGLGIAPDAPDNAVTHARMPHLTAIRAAGGRSVLQASGEAVGLPAGEMGNSEVGHITLGGGRILRQSLQRINDAIDHGTLGDIPAIAERLTPGRPLHLIGLLSDGGVHSHIDHLFALLALARERGVGPIYIHALTDGRDVPQKSALTYLAALQTRIEELGLTGTARIASLGGRFYGMDRDDNWDRVEPAYAAITGAATMYFPSAEAAVEHAYAAGLTDEFFSPVGIGEPVRMNPDDDIIFFNFRTDRAARLAAALVDPAFTHFARTAVYPHLTVCGPYSDIAAVAFPAEPTANHLTEYLSSLGHAVLKSAETEKYAHVTKFFNGLTEEPFPGEDRILIPSPKVNSYTECPAMSAVAIAERVTAAVREKDYTLVVVNFANPDMTGHTGSFDAAVAGLEAMDAAFGSLVEMAREKGYTLVVTADHGNAEKMRDEHAAPHTAHTTNPVECVVAGPDGAPVLLRNEGGLADIAPTILALLGLPQPREMTGQPLVV